eukprot:TRINITY_DN594_c0_g2_i3.p1 TRINITY_DN594_c0_g2~~TRINITY_DN594_c0_g2_i3.p1  ORF type:complete len:819 (-),score=107.48 TRINITY_DN594_c0_g2_i3:21-2477(-)
MAYYQPPKVGPTQLPLEVRAGQMLAELKTMSRNCHRRQTIATDRHAQHLLTAITEAHKEFLDLGGEVTHAVKSRIVFTRLLCELLDLMASEYGFIGEVITKDGEPVLRTLAITDISWNSELKIMVAESIGDGLEFAHMESLFGLVITSNDVVISNNPSTDPRGAGIPEGHPPLNAFIGLPFNLNNECIGMVGLANRPGGYNQEDVEFLSPFLLTCSSLINSLRTQRARHQAEIQLKEMNANIQGLLEERTQAYMRAREKVEKMALIKSFFLATMSHEIRTPLNGLMGNIELLKETPLSAEQTSFVDGVRASGMELHGVLTDVLDLSKVEAGEISIVNRPVTLWNIFDQLVELPSLKGVKTRCPLSFKVLPQTPSWVSVDASHLRQVLVALIQTMSRYCQNGAINVCAEAPESTPGKLRFLVRGEGSFSQETITTLFQLFQNLTDTVHLMARHAEVSGAGFIIAGAMIDAMEGTLDISSSEGHADFDLLLPYEAVLTDVPASSIESKLKQRRDNITLYLIDRDTERLDSISSLVQEYGIPTRRFDSWPDFVQAAEIRPNHNHVVIIDRIPFFESRMEILQALDKHQNLAVWPAASAMGYDLMTAIEDRFSVRLTYPITQSFLCSSLVDLLTTSAMTHGTSQGDGHSKVTDDPASGLPSQSQPKVLVVDDNRMNQVVITKMLAKLGYQVAVAGDGQEAVDNLQDNHIFDLVLMDLHMPVLDGLEATKIVRKQEALSGRPRVPIIALTADVMLGERGQCIDAGMDDFLTKPVSKHDLALAITATCCGTPSPTLGKSRDRNGDVSMTSADRAGPRRTTNSIG